MSSFYRTIDKMFNGISTKITKQQEEFVFVNLGLKDPIDPNQMKSILYKALFIWLFSERPVKWLISGLRSTLFKKS
jgi:hypothetical protein